MSDTPMPIGENLVDESEPGIPANTDYRSDKTRHSIGSLGLDIDSAENGQYWRILPVDERVGQRCKDYPLPHSISELKRVGTVQLKRGSGDSGSIYIRRCKAEYRARCATRDPGRLEQAADKARFKVREIEVCKEQAKTALNDVRNEVRAASATLHDLYGLIRAGSEKILGGFVRNEPVNGEVIGPGDFTNLTGKVLGHIAKLGGVSDDDKHEAEDAVFEQAVAAARKRIEDDRNVGIKAPSTETEQ